jgi:hypothetical protein
MKYACVTSMHEKYYNHIGGIMVRSWEKYWPKESTLTLYNENFIPTVSNRVILKDWQTHCGANHAEFCPKCDDKSTQKFAKKGFAFLDALKTVDCDYLVWLDADLLFSKDIPYDQLDRILPANKLVALFDCFYQEFPQYTTDQYLNSSARKFMAAESGFVVVNKKHKDFPAYVAEYERLFTAETKDPSLVSWYDGEVALSAARAFLEEVVDLSQLRTTNKTQTPLNKTWLAEYVTHQKGRSKNNYTTEQLEEFTRGKE